MVSAFIANSIKSPAEIAHATVTSDYKRTTAQEKTKNRQIDNNINNKIQVLTQCVPFVFEFVLMQRPGREPQ